MTLYFFLNELHVQNRICFNYLRCVVVLKYTCRLFHSRGVYFVIKNDFGKDYITSDQFNFSYLFWK